MTQFIYTILQGYSQRLDPSLRNLFLSYYFKQKDYFSRKNNEKQLDATTIKENAEKRANGRESYLRCYAETAHEDGLIALSVTLTVRPFSNNSNLECYSKQFNYFQNLENKISNQRTIRELKPISYKSYELSHNKNLHRHNVYFVPNRSQGIIWFTQTICRINKNIKDHQGGIHITLPFSYKKTIA